MTHGAHAEVLSARLEPKLQQIYDTLSASAPLRDSRGDLPVYDEYAVRLLAQTLCRLQSVHEYIEKHGVANSSRGRGDSVLKHESRLQNQALRIMSELGMTPRSRAALGLDLAKQVNLADALSEPDAAKREVLLREAGVDD